MATQTSQLISNLQNIYSEKLLIKQAIPTTSDNFSDYHTYIAALHPSGTSYISANGLSDVSSYQFAYVTVEGGGSSSSSDPWYDSIHTYEMIENEESSADYVRSTICDNFEYEEENGEYTISWDDIEEIDTGEVDQNDEPILEEKTIHVVLTGDPHGIYAEGSNIASALEDYPNDLYYNIFPILENATFTASEDPSNDGYDYLLEGDLYAWNLSDESNQVYTITENGFYAANGELGFNVDVEGLSKGSFYIFNWLEMGGGNNAKIAMDNKPLSQLVLFNLEPINYIDPTTQEDTHNEFYGISLHNSNQDTFVMSDFQTTASHYNGGGNYIGFTGLDNESPSDTFDSIDVTLQVWESDIDPQTGMDMGSWKASDEYFASFSDPYTITSDDKIVINVHIFNNNLVTDLFINGILIEESVTLTEVV